MAAISGFSQAVVIVQSDPACTRSLRSLKWFTSPAFRTGWLMALDATEYSPKELAALCQMPEVPPSTREGSGLSAPAIWE